MSGNFVPIPYTFPSSIKAPGNHKKTLKHNHLLQGVHTYQLSNKRGGSFKSSISIPMAKPSSKLIEFEQVFRCFDKDGDGKISASELRLLMGTIGEELSAEEAEKLVESADSDGDGLLELEEFQRLVEAEGEGEEEKSRDLRVAFEMYEMEGEGCITEKSLKRMLSRLGASRELEECKAMICSFDLNGDGVLSFEEFTIMMMV